MEAFGDAGKLGSAPSPFTALRAVMRGPPVRRTGRAARGTPGHPHAWHREEKGQVTTNLVASSRIQSGMTAKGSGGEALDELAGGGLEAGHFLVDLGEVLLHLVDLGGDAFGVGADRGDR